MSSFEPSSAPPPPSARAIFCNRTLNLRSIKAIGFDMDYTLIHYQTGEWERLAYEHARAKLLERGWPLEGYSFDPTMVTLGLVFDLENGNILKTNRFGYVVRAAHGTKMLDFEEQRRLYARELVDLSEPRWQFLNTLFTLSEGCLYAQAVELHDAGKLPGIPSYGALYRAVRSVLDLSHAEGVLKGKIVENPGRFVVPDPELPLAMLDLLHAGKKLLLITNSEWDYTHAMMTHAFDRWLPKGMTWRELFDVVIVEARKPSFFLNDNALFHVETDDGLLRPARIMEAKGTYHGGNAALIEKSLSLTGDEILYVGDHIFADVHVSKNVLRWRTALVVRELEDELSAIDVFAPKQAELTKLMEEKTLLEHQFSELRLAAQRIEKGYGPVPETPMESMREQMRALRGELVALDDRIAPLAKEAGELMNPRWGLLMRAGNDKSNFARQLERYADVYLSRVANLLFVTPFVYARAPRLTMPHDPGT